MRIISGRYRGRQINPPAGFSARPTTDFARESLFDILSNRVDFKELDVLDLFAGTGSISYEFASRGARNVHLVEFERHNISFIRRTVKEIGIENIKPLRIDVRDFIKACREKYDIIFADPPYDLTWLDEIPGMVISADLIKESGFFILEHPKSYSFVSHPAFFEHRRYGSVNFSFFRPGEKS